MFLLVFFLHYETISISMTYSSGVYFYLFLDILINQVRDISEDFANPFISIVFKPKQELRADVSLLLSQENE